MPIATHTRQTITNETISEETGKSLDEWFKILDRWGARKKGHTAIVRYLRTEHDMAPSWAQELTDEYERDRRASGDMDNGSYDVSVQRTIATTPKKAYAAMTDPTLLGRWYTTQARSVLRVGGSYSFADGTHGNFLLLEPRRKLKFTWDNKKKCPRTVVEITFSENAQGKVAVRVTHSKLKSEADQKSMKDNWSDTMNLLKTFLEQARPLHGRHRSVKGKARQ